MPVTGRARPRRDLVMQGSPSWPDVSATLSDSAVSVEVLPVDPGAGEACLRRTGATVDSWLGAMAMHTGGLLVDHGWLRVYGGGSPARRLPDLAEVNPDPEASGYLLVGADVLGGRYVIRGRDPEPDAAGVVLPGKPGEICYLGPDTLRWEPLEWTYRDWLSLMLGGAVADFYHDLRWPGWEAEAPGVPLDRLLSLYPPVYTKEGRAGLADAERQAVPADELYGLIDELTAERAAG
ncbi:DUF2625 family protein [Actinocatenispora rupis]|uniref:DUF2625 family protein n=1 Tax=Actinocatenispora rupis TaxID=519421 RepID=A0A8J3J2Y7_9ACTN|nr:DUF2625 family protein [Actinocatenispora rupis]GID13635.1 hypothetical protein Aru02nite_45240 [Actinocatenispora rupis]